MNFFAFFILFCKFLAVVFGQTCGRVLVGRSNIIGGNYVVHGAYPWVAVLIDSNGDHFCGGTLLSKNKVLTAAHCIKGKDDSHEFLARDLTVILGAHNLTKIHEHGKISVGVQSIDIHRDWNTKSASFDADIAVLTLTDDVGFTRFIQPICLMDSESEPADIKSGYTTGYGKSEKDTNNENILKSVITPIANSNEECFYTNQALVKISSIRTLCGGSRGGAGVCLGDSGNGLVVEQSQTYYLRGIVSASLFSNNNCDVNNHAIFTDVLKFNQWIIERLDQVDRIFVYGPSGINVPTTTTTTTQRTTTTRRITTTTTSPPRRSPSIVPFESPVEIIEGSNFELPCQTYGSPSPTVTWTKATTADANVGRNGHILVINNVSFRNSGKYICEATNSEGTDTEDVFIIVKSAASAGQVPWETNKNPSLRQMAPPEPPKRAVSQLGNTNEFKCSAEGNFDIFWRRADGKSLEKARVNSNGILIIDSAGYEDAGLYECIATDNYGNSAIVLSAYLEIIGGPVTSGGLFGGNRQAQSGPPRISFQPNSFNNPVTAGDQLYITCIVTGSEPMSVNWALVGRPSSLSSAKLIDNTLRFDRVLMSDVGKYACIAENSYGRAEKSFTLFVNPGFF